MLMYFGLSVLKILRGCSVGGEVESNVWFINRVDN